MGLLSTFSLSKSILWSHISPATKVKLDNFVGFGLNTYKEVDENVEKKGFVSVQ